MAELLFWNTLTEAANWLSETLGEQVTPKSLIQKILDRAESAGKPFPPTIIKALLPRDVRIASVLLFPKNGDIGEVERRINERITEAYGEPSIKGSVYTGNISAEAIPLYPAQIADLIKHENVEISLIQENQLGGYKFRIGEHGCILPLGTKHLATIETCGINRTDLLGLHGQLVKSQPLRHHTIDINQQGVEVNNIRYVVIKDLVWEIAQKLADKNREQWSSPDSDDNMRRTIVSAMNQHGWKPDGVPGLLPHVFRLHEVGKITVRSTFNGLPPTESSEIGANPSNWYVSHDDAETIRKELLQIDDESSQVETETAADVASIPESKSVLSASDSNLKNTNTQDEWTAEELTALSKYRNSHTVKETAEKYGISQSRVYQLLNKHAKKSSIPTANNPWGGKISAKKKP